MELQMEPMLDHLTVVALEKMKVETLDERKVYVKEQPLAVEMVLR